MITKSLKKTLRWPLTNFKLKEKPFKTIFKSPIKINLNTSKPIKKVKLPYKTLKSKNKNLKKNFNAVPNISRKNLTKSKKCTKFRKKFTKIS